MKSTTVPFRTLIPRLTYGGICVGDQIVIDGATYKVTSIQKVRLLQSNNLEIVGRAKEAPQCD